MKKLPVDLELQLPGPDWKPVEPESFGVQNAALLLVRHNLSETYAPTISISGDVRSDPATMAEIADESLALLRAQARHVELLQRDEVGTPEAPAITQVVEVITEVNEENMNLRQGQVLTGLIDTNDPDKRVVLIYTLTCTSDQFPQMAQEFQTFMGTVRPVPTESSPGTA